MCIRDSLWLVDISRGSLLSIGRVIVSRCDISLCVEHRRHILVEVHAIAVKGSAVSYTHLDVYKRQDAAHGGHINHFLAQNLPVRHDDDYNSSNLGIAIKMILYFKDIKSILKGKRIGLR